MKEMAEEVAKLVNLAVLGDDEVGLAMQLMLTNYGNSLAPKNPSITNQVEAVYNVNYSHYSICWRHLSGAGNQKPCVHFIPDIEPILGRR